MSVFFRFKDGYIGTVSEKVSKVLEAKGEGVVQSPKPGVDMATFVAANNRGKGGSIDFTGKTDEGAL